MTPHDIDAEERLNVAQGSLFEGPEQEDRRVVDQPRESLAGRGTPHLHLGGGDMLGARDVEEKWCSLPTRPVPPTRSGSWRATIPVPQATSSTRSPKRNPAKPASSGAHRPRIAGTECCS